MPARDVSVANTWPTMALRDVGRRLRWSPHISRTMPSLP